MKRKNTEAPKPAKYLKENKESEEIIDVKRDGNYRPHKKCTH